MHTYIWDLCFCSKMPGFCLIKSATLPYARYSIIIKWCNPLLIVPRNATMFGCFNFCKTHYLLQLNSTHRKQVYFFCHIFIRIETFHCNISFEHFSKVSFSNSFPFLKSYIKFHISALYYYSKPLYSSSSTMANL
jgi:hypothetical protein